MLKQVSSLQEKVDAMQKKSTLTSEAGDSNDEMEGSFGSLMELSETTKAFLVTMPNEDRKKRVGKAGIPNYDQIRYLKLDGVLKAVLPKDAIKVDRYLSRLQHFWLDAVAPLAALLESAEAWDLTVGKGSFSHPDCPVLNGECAPADGTVMEKEADFEAQSFFKIHGRGQQKLCFCNTNVVWGRIC